MRIHTIGIIGFGSFGQFLYGLIQERWPQVPVSVYSSDREVDGERFFSLEDTGKADLLFLCVPIAAFAQTVATIAPLLGTTTIVVDIATVKSYTVSVLKACKIPRYIAAHPMFGPYSYAKHGKTLQDLRVVLCDNTLTAQERQMVVDLLHTAGMKVLQYTADAHDKLVAETLFLAHLIGQTIHRGGFERTAIDTVSFGFLMDVVESVARDEALFKDVYRFNPYCKEVVARLEQAEGSIKASLEEIGSGGDAVRG